MEWILVAWLTCIDCWRMGLLFVLAQLVFKWQNRYEDYWDNEDKKECRPSIVVMEEGAVFLLLYSMVLVVVLQRRRRYEEITDGSSSLQNNNYFLRLAWHRRGYFLCAGEETGAALTVENTMSVNDGNTIIYDAPVYSRDKAGSMHNYELHVRYFFIFSIIKLSLMHTIRTKSHRLRYFLCSKVRLKGKCNYWIESSPIVE